MKSQHIPAGDVCCCCCCCKWCQVAPAPPHAVALALIIPDCLQAGRQGQAGGLHAIMGQQRGASSCQSLLPSLTSHAATHLAYSKMPPASITGPACRAAAPPRQRSRADQPLPALLH